MSVAKGKDVIREIKSDVENEIVIKKEYFKIEGGLRANFCKILNNKKLEEFESFELFTPNTKIYHYMIMMINSRLNQLLNIDLKVGDVMFYRYLCMKKDIDNGKFDNKKDLFKSMLYKTFLDDDFMKSITTYVDTHYNSKVDLKYASNYTKYDVSTIFIDEHYKIILSITLLSNVLIPIILHYSIRQNKTYGESFIHIEMFIYDIMIHLFRYCETISAGNGNERADIYNKLYCLVEKNIKIRSNVTDRGGMSNFNKYGFTSRTGITKIMNMLIPQIFPKFRFDGDCVIMINVIIREYITDYVVNKQFPYATYPSLNISVDDDKSSDSSRAFDSFDNKRDEKRSVLLEYAPSRNLVIIENKYEIEYEKGEVEFYLKTMKEKHHLQELLISQVFSKDFSGMINISGCDRIEFVKLCVILHHRLKRYNLTHLSELILANKTSHLISRYPTRQVQKMVNNNQLYTSVLDKYKFVQKFFNSKLENRNSIVENIVNIINYNYSKNIFNAQDNGTILEKDIESIITEVLEMNNSLIN